LALAELSEQFPGCKAVAVVDPVIADAAGRQVDISAVIAGARAVVAGLNGFASAGECLCKVLTGTAAECDAVL
jgi:hypothetical protein